MVQISGVSKNGTWAFRVKDNGLGIASKTRNDFLQHSGGPGCLFSRRLADSRTASGPDLGQCRNSATLSLTRAQPESLRGCAVV